MLKKTVSLIIVLGLVLSFAVIGAGANGENEEERYLAVTLLVGLDYHVDWMRAFDVIEENNPNISAEVVGPTDYDINAMINRIDTAVTKGMDGILVIGWEKALVPAINRAIEDGVPVVMIGSSIPDPDLKALTYLGTSNEYLGQTAGEYLANKIGQKGKVMVMRDPSLPNVRKRAKNFLSVMDKHDKIEVVATLNDQSDFDQAAVAWKNAFQKYDVDGVYAADGIASNAAATAIREAGIEEEVETGELTVLASDRADSVLKSVQDGLITATLVQHSPVEAYLGIKVLEMMDTGLQLSYNDAEAGISLVPRDVFTGATIVEQDQVRYFRRDYPDENPEEYEEGLEEKMSKCIVCGEED